VSLDNYIAMQKIALTNAKKAIKYVSIMIDGNDAMQKLTPS
jgi:hypothetical protein